MPKGVAKLLTSIQSVSQMYGTKWLLQKFRFSYSLQSKEKSALVYFSLLAGWCLTLKPFLFPAKSTLGKFGLVSRLGCFCLWVIHGLSLWGSHVIYAVSQDFIDVVFVFVTEVRWAFTLLCCTLTFSFLLICTFFCGQHLEDHLIKSRIIIKKKMEYNHCTILSLIVCNGFQSWKRLFCCTLGSFNMTMVSILNTIALIVILIEEHITVILIAIGMARCKHI
jgi:hypothetical protein